MRPPPPLRPGPSALPPHPPRQPPAHHSGDGRVDCRHGRGRRGYGPGAAVRRRATPAVELAWVS